MMHISFMYLNQWMKIGIGFLAAAFICMIIGLGCFGAKMDQTTYYRADIKVGVPLKHTASELGLDGSAAAAFTAWKAGAAFAAILTPISAGIGLISVSYGLFREI